MGVESAKRQKEENLYTFTANKKSYNIVIANDCQTREESYKLMYDIYSEQSYGQSHYSKMWFSLHEIIPSTVTVMVKHKGRAVATMTVAADFSIEIPANLLYKDILEKKRKLGHRIGEVFSLGIIKEERGNKLILGKLINFSYIASRYINHLTHWAITVVPHHVNFYCKQMLFESGGDARFHEKTGVYCKFLYHPLNVFDNLDEREWKRTFYKYYFPKAKEYRILNSLEKSIRPISKREIFYFLANRPEIWENATKREQDYIIHVLQSS